MRHPFTQETELMKMETPHHRMDDQMKVLYEASYKGCASILDSLIERDPLILHRINSRTIFIETPLHISALLGHLDFTKALLTCNPKLALGLDPFKSTALHLASAEGHIDIVKELLQASDEADQACLVPDQEKRIPLHYAVIRGRLAVVEVLIRAKPESLRILDNGKTILHLCVTFNHLEILKALVELDIDRYELLNSRDLDGKNTILHLAIMLKQVEIVRYLLSIPEIREASNLENDMGFTAHDILQRIPQDFKSLEIQVILMNNGIKSEKKEMDTPQAPTTTDVVDEAVRPPKKCWRNILECTGKWFKYNVDWLKDVRGHLSVVATFISAITFQVALNPPGSFIQQDMSSSIGISSCHSTGADACPGEATLAFQFPDDFRNFMVYNTISFVASLGVTLLLVSGVPLRNNVVMCILSIGMCITLTSLALTYFSGLSMLTPSQLWDSTDKMFNIASFIWIGLLGLVGVYLIARFVIWLGKKCMKRIKHQMSMCPRNRNGNGCCLI